MNEVNPILPTLVSLLSAIAGGLVVRGVMGAGVIRRGEEGSRRPLQGGGDLA